jgi:hypothetical protein
MIEWMECRVQASSVGSRSAVGQEDTLTIAGGLVSLGQGQGSAIHSDAKAAEAIFICVAGVAAPVASRGVECRYRDGGSDIELWRETEPSYCCREGLCCARKCAPYLFWK